MKTKRNTKVVKNKTKRATSSLHIIPENYKNITGIIDIDAIRHNHIFFKRKAKTDIMPVLKADAYGHGIVEMAKILRNLHVKYLGVATVGEAILLRNNGDKGRILCWLYDIDSPEIKDALKMDIDIAIIDETFIPIIEKMVPSGKKAKITLFVDTGINRAGVSYDKSYQAAIDISKIDKFEFVGMMSHLICSEIKNSPIVNEQLKKFRDLRQKLEDIHIKPPLVHIANTTGCLNYDVSDFTLARVGGGTYGITVDKKRNKNLIPIMTLKTKIIQLKLVPKGQGIGYNSKYITPKNMRVAAVPIGYADILPRAASLKLCVYVNGSKRKVLGLISMDQIIIESKDNDNISDDVFIFGDGKNCKQTVFDIAEIANTITYEFLTHVGNRVNRIYQ